MAAHTSYPPHFSQRVVIVEDQLAVRQMLTRALQRAGGIEVIGGAGAAAEGLCLIAQHQPDVVILDLELPDTSGAEVIRQVRAAHPDIGIIVWTGYPWRWPAASLSALGARRYVVKTEPLAHLVQAIRDLAQEPPSYLSLEHSATLDSRPVHLTRREVDVLQLIAEDLSDKEVAQRLTISVKAVEAHLAHLREKFHVRSRAGLVLHAYRQNFL